MSGPATVFPLLATRLLAANPSPSPALTRVITDYSTRWDAGGLPLALVYLEWDAENSIGQEALGQPGLMRDTYHVQIDVFLGVMTGPDLVQQYHNLAKPWGQALGKALIADVTLGGAVAFIGDPSTPELFKYKFRVIPWQLTQTNYFGLTLTLPVTEKVSTNVG